MKKQASLRDFVQGLCIPGGVILAAWIGEMFDAHVLVFLCVLAPVCIGLLMSLTVRIPD